MKLYRTTRYLNDVPVEVRYRTSKRQFAAMKGMRHWSWRHRESRLVLDVAEIPDDAWTKVEEA